MCLLQSYRYWEALKKKLKVNFGGELQKNIFLKAGKLWSFLISCSKKYIQKSLSTDAEWNNGDNDYRNEDDRYSFRCDHYYEDGSCYGGTDGGGCNNRKKREEVASRPAEDIVIRGRDLATRWRRQIDDVIGCQKESTNGIDYRGRAAETVDGVPCMKWTEGVTEDEHNFCRNPTDDPNGVWCNTGASSTGYCNVPKCDPLITTREAECVDWIEGRAYWKWDYEIPDTCTRENSVLI